MCYAPRWRGLDPSAKQQRSIRTTALAWIGDYCLDVEATLMALESALDVLIVDDVPDIPLALSAMLIELAEVNISIASDGQEAMVALADKRFDLLFLDLQVPIVSGEEILDAIAAGEHNLLKPSHIIAMSAGARLQELQGRPSGKLINGLLEKPFQYSDLQGIIADVTMGDFFSDL